MSKRPTSTSESPPPGLLERAIQVAEAVGVEWNDLGQGVYLNESEYGAPVWRAHSDFSGTGSIVDVDATTGEVLCVEEAYHGSRPFLVPQSHWPSLGEATEFLREKVSRIGWHWPDAVVGESDAHEGVWHLSGQAVEPNRGFRARVEGLKGRLRVSKLARK